MRGIDFFIDKAKKYITEIDSINESYIQYDYNRGIGEIMRRRDENDPYEIQSRRVSELELKVKLMFTEFDKGELFLNKFEKIEKNQFSFLSENGNLYLYKDLLTLFVEHLIEFRVEVIDEA